MVVGNSKPIVLGTVSCDVDMSRMAGNETVIAINKDVILQAYVEYSHYEAFDGKLTVY